MEVEIRQWETFVSVFLYMYIYFQAFGRYPFAGKSDVNERGGDGNRA